MMDLILFPLSLSSVVIGYWEILGVNGRLVTHNFADNIGA